MVLFVYVSGVVIADLLFDGSATGLFRRGGFEHALQQRPVALLVMRRSRA